jgi:hypothetical protein
LENFSDTNNNTCFPNAPGITPYDGDGDPTPDIFDLVTDNDRALNISEGLGKYAGFAVNNADADRNGFINDFDLNTMLESSCFIC